MNIAMSRMPEGYVYDDYRNRKRSHRHAVGRLRQHVRGVPELAIDFSRRAEGVEALGGQLLHVTLAEAKQYQMMDPRGYALTSSRWTGQHRRRILVEELYVPLTDRKQGIARWMLHKLAFGDSYTDKAPTSLEIGGGVADVPGFAEALTRTGFRPSSTSGLPRLRLPGRIKPVSVEQHEAITNGGMVEGWNGVLHVEDRQQPFMELYRGGVALARISEISQPAGVIIEDMHQNVQRVITATDGPLLIDDIERAAMLEILNPQQTL